MKYLLIALLLCLTGCSTTVPVTAKFPEAPNTIQQQCPPLQKLKDDAKLSDIATTVTIKNNMLVTDMDKFLEPFGFVRVETFLPSPNWTWGDAIFVKRIK